MGTIFEKPPVDSELPEKASATATAVEVENPYSPSGHMRQGPPSPQMNENFMKLRGMMVKEEGDAAASLKSSRDHAVIAEGCQHAIRKHYPTAISTLALDTRLITIANSFGISRSNCLVARCFCPDEINTNVTQLHRVFAGDFNLGGLAGVPCGGARGLATFWNHVPDNGNIIIMYGPHVGISDSGELGKVIRRGQKGLSSSCGSAVAAMTALLKEHSYEVDKETDHQQYVVANEVRSQLDRIKASNDPVLELTEVMFESIESKLLKAVSQCGHEFMGKILLAGGILVNTHHGLSDHFVPRTLKLHHTEGVEDLLPMLLSEEKFRVPTMRPLNKLTPVCEEALAKHFPHAILDIQLLLRVATILRERGIHRDNTLFAHSTCPDELNRLPRMFRDKFGSSFRLGGVTGIPFAGRTGFNAFLHHVPRGGNIFLLYGPHIGLSDNGDVGKVVRHGQTRSTLACGSAIHAWRAAVDNSLTEENEDDYEQFYVTKVLRENKDKISQARLFSKELSTRLFQTIERDLLKIVDKSFSGYVVLLGGVIVNVPGRDCDYFEPHTFAIMEKGRVTEDLLPHLNAA